MCLARQSDRRSSHLLASVRLETIVLDGTAGPEAYETLNNATFAFAERNANETLRNGAGASRPTTDGLLQSGESLATGAREASKYLDIRLSAKLVRNLKNLCQSCARYLKQFRARVNMTRASTGSDGASSSTIGQEPGGQASPILAEHEDHPTEREPASDEYSFRCQSKQLESQDLIRTLSQARLFNLLLAISHLLVLISAIDYGLAGRYLSQTRTLTFQNFQSRVLRFPHCDVSSNEDPMSVGAAAAPKSTSSRNPRRPSHRAERSAREILNSMMALEDGAPRRRQTSRRGRRDEDTNYKATSWQRSSIASMGQSSSSSSSPPSPSPSPSSSSSPSPPPPQPPPPSSLKQISGYDEIIEPGERCATTSNASSLIGTNMCYYLLIVTLMDFFANKDWRPLRGESQFVSPATAASGCAQLTRAPPATVRRPALVALAQLGSLARWLGSTFFLFATSPKHLFQFTQVAFLMMFPPEANSSLRGLNSFMGPLNALNQAVRFALCTYKVHCHLTLARDDALVRHEQLDRSEFEFSRKAAGLNLSEVKRYLMISQLFYLKVTIMTLLIQLDSTPIRFTLKSLSLVVCLVQTFHIMFLVYNQYHTLYSSDQDDEYAEANKLKLD